MMKYVLLAYRDEKRWESMSASERVDFEAACQASERELTRSLHLTEVQALQDSTALTIRFVDGNPSLSDSPVHAGSELLIQLLFIQARDLNAAIQIALQMPQAQAGPIEVRPIVE